MYNLDFRRFSVMGTTSCAVPNNLYAISTNYHVNIAMPTYTYLVLTSINSCFVHVQQHAPSQNAGVGTSLFRQELVLRAINLFPMLCLRWIFFNLHRVVPLCVQHPAKAMSLHIWCAPPILFWPWPPFNLFPRSRYHPFSLSIFTEGQHFACNAQQTLCHFNKLSYFVLTIYLVSKVLFNMEFLCQSSMVDTT